MTEQNPIHFPLEAPGGSIALQRSRSDGRSWFFDVAGAGGLRIQAPDMGGVLAERMTGGFVVYFRFVSGVIRPLGNWNPPIVSVVRLAISGLSVPNVEELVAGQLFAHAIGRGAPHIVLHSWIDRTQRLAWFGSREEGRFALTADDGSSRANEFVAGFWNTPASGTRTPAAKPLLQVRAADRLILELAESLPPGVHAELSLVHEDRAGRFYYDVPEFFDRLADAGKLLRGDTANFEFASRSGRAVQPYLKVLGVPEADAELEALQSPTHQLVRVRGGHSRIELTVPFRDPASPEGTEPQTFVVPPEVMRLEPDLRDVDNASSPLALIGECDVTNASSPAPFRWELFPDSALPSRSSPGTLTSAFASGSVRTLQHDPPSLYWEEFRALYDLEAVRARPNLVVAQRDRFLGFRVLPNLLTLLQTRLGLLGFHINAQRAALYDTEHHHYDYRMVDAMGLFAFMRETARYRGTGDVQRQMREDVEASRGPVYRSIESAVDEMERELRDMIFGARDDSIASIVSNPAFAQQLEAAGLRKKAEVLSDLILFLGSHDAGTELLGQLGALSVFDDVEPPRPDGMPLIYEAGPLKLILSVATEAVTQEHLGKVYNYTVLASLRRRMGRQLAGGSLTDAQVARIIDDARPAFRRAGFEVGERDGRFVVTEVDVEGGAARVVRVLQHVGLALSLYSLWTDYHKASSTWDRAGLVVNTIDAIQGTATLVGEHVRRYLGREAASIPVTDIPVAGRTRLGFRGSPAGGIAIAVGVYNATTFIMEGSEFGSRGDSGASTASYVAAFGEGLAVVGGVLSFTAAGAPAGLALMALGFLISLGSSIVRELVRRNEFQNVLQHTLLGTQTARSVLSNSPYHDMADHVPLQLRRVMSAAYPIAVEDVSFRGGARLSIKPTVAEVGSLVFLRLLDGSGQIVARFGTPIYAREVAEGTQFSQFLESGDLFPQETPRTINARLRARHFETSVERDADEGWTIGVHLHSSFNNQLASVTKAEIYCTPARALGLPMADFAIYFTHQNWPSEPSGRSWLWPDVDWIDTRPDLTLTAFAAD